MKRTISRHLVTTALTAMMSLWFAPLPAHAQGGVPSAAEEARAQARDLSAQARHADAARVLLAAADLMGPESGALRLEAARAHTTGRGWEAALKIAQGITTDRTLPLALRIDAWSQAEALFWMLESDAWIQRARALYGAMAPQAEDPELAAIQGDLKAVPGRAASMVSELQKTRQTLVQLQAEDDPVMAQLDEIIAEFTKHEGTLGGLKRAKRSIQKQAAARSRALKKLTQGLDKIEGVIAAAQRTLAGAGDDVQAIDRVKTTLTITTLAKIQDLEADLERAGAMLEIRGLEQVRRDLHEIKAIIEVGDLILGS